MKEFEQITSKQAIVEATSKANDMAKGMPSLYVTFANNSHLVYGCGIAEAIPVSKAAVAVAELQTASFGWGLIRLMALWDKASRDRASIPTVARLLSKAGAKGELRQKNLNDWKALRASDAECIRHQTSFDLLWGRTFRLIEAVERSGRIVSLRQFRDTYIAHNLKPPTDYKSPRYGQEARLLRATSNALHGLLLLLENTDHGFKHDAQQASEVAADLWTNMHFTIEDQSPASLKAKGRARRLTQRRSPAPDVAS